MSAAEKVEPAISEPLSWEEICRRYPEEFVCLTEVDHEPGSPRVLSARVIGSWRARGEAIVQAELWRSRDHRISVRLTGKYDVTHLRPRTIIDDEIESSFEREDDLIIVEAFVVGPRGQAKGRFALDTGASVTTIIPEVADEIGYSIRDALKRTRVRTAAGSEEGYWLHVARLDVLGVGVERFPVQVFDLGHSELSGLLGMNFLRDFNFEVRPVEQKILLEKILP